MINTEEPSGKPGQAPTELPRRMVRGICPPRAEDRPHLPARHPARPPAHSRIPRSLSRGEREGGSADAWTRVRGDDTGRVLGPVRRRPQRRGKGARQGAPEGGCVQNESKRPCPDIEEPPDFRGIPGESGGSSMAVTVGFEPTVGGYPTQLFESCTFGRSDTSPSSSLRHTGGCCESAPHPAQAASSNQDIRRPQDIPRRDVLPPPDVLIRENRGRAGEPRAPARTAGARGRPHARRDTASATPPWPARTAPARLTPWPSSRTRK